MEPGLGRYFVSCFVYNGHYIFFITALYDPNWTHTCYGVWLFKPSFYLDVGLDSGGSVTTGGYICRDCCRAVSGSNTPIRESQNVIVINAARLDFTKCKKQTVAPGYIPVNGNMLK